MKGLSMRGHKDVIWVDDDIAEKISNVLIDRTDHIHVQFDGRVINTADVRGVFTEDDMGKKPDSRAMMLNAGLDVSTPRGLSDSEHQRKMKIMMDAYIEARNEIRAERGEPPLVDAEIPAIFRRFVA